MFGSRRFDTIDESRNNVFTAVFAVGEGWHNNHHRYQRAARNGFYWWEFDPTWYTIKLMQMLGLAWDVQKVPARIYDEAAARHRRSGNAVSVVQETPIGLELAEDLD
jgi:stearoyl-CoA desaturase (delta-9 desaturase)